MRSEMAEFHGCVIPHALFNRICPEKGLEGVSRECSSVPAGEVVVLFEQFRSLTP